MRKTVRIWVTAVLAGVTLLALFSSGSAVGATGRRTFRATGDNNRNFVSMESNGQLETVFALTSALTAVADVRLDTIQETPSIELTVDFSQLTTGYQDRNAAVFSRTFLDIGAAGSATFRLLGLEKSKNWVLNNEQRVEVSGTGELTLGGKTKIIAIDLFLTYLEANEITRGRLPGDLLHLTGNLNFRMSDFGIRIPEEALLKVNDLIRLHFDVFASTQ